VDIRRDRGWGLRDTVIAIGALAGLAFILIGLTGSDVDEQAAQALGIAVTVVLFTIFGSVGVALARWQPRFALFGAVTVTLSLLACGASVVSVWNDGPSLFGFFGYGGTSGTVGAITDLLAITASATCVLLATARSGEDAPTRLVRVIAIGALALLVALSILAIVDPDIGIGPRVYAILATVYVVATAVLLVLRLLPGGENSSAPS
jgi:hypothetical protein